MSAAAAGRTATRLDVPELARFRAEIVGPVATITFDRPDVHNAQTPNTWLALAQVRVGLPGRGVRVVVLRGEGPSFCAGMDRAMFGSDLVDGVPGAFAMARDTTEAVAAQIGSWQRGFDWTSDPGLVSVAAVQGNAIGGGFQMALGADIRILAEDAQLRMAEPGYGIVPDMGGTKRLVDLVGYSRAAEICLTGRAVGAREAWAIGLASHIVPPGELDAAVARTVDALLTVRPGASSATKNLLQRAASRTTQDEQEALERRIQHGRLREMAGLDPVPA